MQFKVAEIGKNPYLSEPF